MGMCIPSRNPTDPKILVSRKHLPSVDVDVRRHSPLDRNQATDEKKPAGQQSGDSWMYPYQRTPMGNPYISPI